MASRDGKKIVKVLSEMSGIKDICTQIPHLEDEEVFCFTKRKFGSKGDSYHPDKVNSSHPKVQTKYAITRVQLETIAE